MEALIVFQDNTEKIVSRKVAKHTLQVLHGEVKPKSKANEAFCLKVKDVQLFEPIVTLDKDPEPEKKIEQIDNPIIRRTLANKELSGIEKFRAIGYELKRQQALHS